MLFHLISISYLFAVIFSHIFQLRSVFSPSLHFVQNIFLHSLNSTKKIIFTESSESENETVWQRKHLRIKFRRKDKEPFNDKIKCSYPMTCASLSISDSPDISSAIFSSVIPGLPNSSAKRKISFNLDIATVTFTFRLSCNTWWRPYFADNWCRHHFDEYFNT